MAPMWVNLQIDFKFITRKKLIRYIVHVLAADQNGHNPKWPQTKTATIQMATNQMATNQMATIQMATSKKMEISRKVRDLDDKKTVDKCFNRNYKRKGGQFVGF